MQQMFKITGTACHERNVLLDAIIIIGDSYWYGQPAIYFCSELKVWLDSSMGFAFSTRATVRIIRTLTVCISRA